MYDRLRWYKILRAKGIEWKILVWKYYVDDTSFYKVSNYLEITKTMEKWLYKFCNIVRIKYCLLKSFQNWYQSSLVSNPNKTQRKTSFSSLFSVSVLNWNLVWGYINYYVIFTSSI
jgi:hypothetical protein